MTRPANPPPALSLSEAMTWLQEHLADQFEAVGSRYRVNGERILTADDIVRRQQMQAAVRFGADFSGHAVSSGRVAR